MFAVCRRLHWFTHYRRRRPIEVARIRESWRAYRGGQAAWWPDTLGPEENYGRRIKWWLDRHGATDVLQRVIDGAFSHFLLAVKDASSSATTVFSQEKDTIKQAGLYNPGLPSRDLRVIYLAEGTQDTRLEQGKADGIPAKYLQVSSPPSAPGLTGLHHYLVSE
jgi:hypothetical protein